MKKLNKVLALVLGTSLALASLLPGAALAKTESSDQVVRLKGESRVQTAIEVSKRAYPGSADALVLTGYSASADALAGTLLASSKEAPLLVVGREGLTPDLLAEVDRLATKKVYILGGAASVPATVDAALRAKGLTVERVEASNRYGTAVEIAKLAGKKDQIFLALGHGGQDQSGRPQALADALAIGPVSASLARPILLTASQALPAETKAFIQESKVEKVTLVGGTASISQAIVKEIEDLGVPAANIDRIQGANRYETATKIAEKYFPEARQAVLALGTLDVDALVGGVLAYKNQAPILLTPREALAATTRAYIQEQIKKVYLLGGDASISQAVEKDLVQVLAEDRADTSDLEKLIAEKLKDLNQKSFEEQKKILGEIDKLLVKLPEDKREEVQVSLQAAKKSLIQFLTDDINALRIVLSQEEDLNKKEELVAQAEKKLEFAKELGLSEPAAADYQNTISLLADQVREELIYKKIDGIKDKSLAEQKMLVKEVDVLLTSFYRAPSKDLMGSLTKTKKMLIRSLEADILSLRDAADKEKNPSKKEQLLVQAQESLDFAKELGLSSAAAWDYQDGLNKATDKLKRTLILDMIENITKKPLAEQKATMKKVESILASMYEAPESSLEYSVNRAKTNLITSLTEDIKKLPAQVQEEKNLDKKYSLVQQAREKLNFAEELGLSREAVKDYEYKINELWTSLAPLGSQGTVQLA